MNFKEYIAKQMIGLKLHFKCNCLMPLDFIGVVKDYSISGNEIIFYIDSNGKLIKIGENHPNMIVENL